MKKSHSRFYNRLFIRLVLVGIILLSLFMSIFLMYRYKSRYDNIREMLVDSLGQQRWRVIAMSREATRKSVLLEAVNAPDRVESPETVESKITQANSRLAEYRDAFELTLSGMRNGAFHYAGKTYLIPAYAQGATVALLEEMAPSWQVMKKALVQIEGMSQIDTSFRTALIEVNAGSEIVFSYSRRVMDALLAGMAVRHRLELGLFIGLISLLMAGVLIVLVGMFRFYIRPLDRLYVQLTESGVTGPFLKPETLAITPVLEEMNDVLSSFRDMVDMIGSINNSQSFREVLQFVYDAFRKHIPYDYIGIALFRQGADSLLEGAIGVSDGSFAGLPKRMIGLAFPMEETSLERLSRDRQPRIINDLEAHLAGRALSEYNRILLEEGIRASITLPLVRQDKLLGFMFFSSRRTGVYNQRHCDFLETLSNAIVIAIEKNLFLDELLYSSLLALAKLAEARDEDTAVHLDRIKAYTALLCRCLIEDDVHVSRLTDDYVKDIVRFSPMHDIGKVGIRDGILLKPGKLTADEFEHMKTHTTFGANVLREAENNMIKLGRSLFRVGIEIADAHHERWDGSGYPIHRSGEAIPLSARIVAVVDVFDALLSRRPYKEPFSFEDAVRTLVEGSGKHFDPQILDSFVRHQDCFRSQFDDFRQANPDAFR